MSETYRFIGCTVCGFRMVEAEIGLPHSGNSCYNCGSQLMILESNLSREIANVLRQHAESPGVPEPQNNS